MNDFDPVAPPAQTDPTEYSAATGRVEVLHAAPSPKVRAALESLERHDAYDWSRLFPKTAGIGAAGDIKRRVRMLRSVEPRFDYLLYPEERVEFVTKGVLNSFAEQYFLGLWSIMISRTLFLFTNYRVLLIHCDRRGRAKSMMWQIPYHRVRKYGAGGVTGSVGFKLDDGKNYKFAGVPRADRKRLKSYVRAQIDRVRAEQFEFPSHSARDPLCPACATPQPRAARDCAACGEAFVNPIKPALMSCVIPGLGDFYLGHRGMAIIELLGFALLLFIVFGAFVSGDTNLITTWLVLLAIANAIDGAITFHIARKGMKLRSRAWKSD
jgi:hypothetical protein